MIRRLLTIWRKPVPLHPDPEYRAKRLAHLSPERRKKYEALIAEVDGWATRKAKA